MSKSVSYIECGIYQGTALVHFAQTYPTPTAAILEMIQNSIDANARSIIVRVEAKTKRLYCIDDGDGETYEGIVERFGNIAKQQKVGKIGHKGIGNLAALSILDKENGVYNLTTRPKPKFTNPERFFTITLERAGLEQKEKLSFPCEIEPKNFRPGQVYKTGAEIAVTTIAVAKNLSKAALRVLKDPTDIVRAIEGRFATQILENNIRIVVEIGGHRLIAKPSAFPGEPQIFEVGTVSGTVRFEIYPSAKAVKNPKIEIVHGMTIAEQSMLPMYGELLESDDSIKEVFGSGHIQGRIYIPFGKLQTNRLAFEYDDDLALVWSVLETFSKKFGKPLLEEIAIEQKETKTLNILLGALRKVKRVLSKNPELNEFFKGLVTTGHYDTEGREAGKSRTEPVKPRSPRTEQPTPRPEPQKTKDTPHVSVPGSGSHRKKPRGKQIGLQVDWIDPTPDDPLGRDWCSRLEGSLILFNSLHPLWQQVESNPTAHDAYAFHLILKEVSIASSEMNDEAKHHFNMTFEKDYLPKLIDGVS